MRVLIPLLFFVLIYVEVSLFVAIANTIGVFFSLLLLFSFCGLGAYIIKNKGFKNRINIREEMTDDHELTQSLRRKFAFTLSGILFVIPGFFTDLVGALLCIPIIQNWVITRLLKKMTVTRAQEKYQNNHEEVIVIEGEYAKKSDDDKNKK